jgi:hypothetical protein
MRFVLIRVCSTRPLQNSVGALKRIQQPEPEILEIFGPKKNPSGHWKCGLEFDHANEESFYCRPLRLEEGSLIEKRGSVDAMIAVSFITT